MTLIGIKDFERVSPVFAGKQGNALARRLMHWVAIDKIGELYDRNIAYQGPAFVDHIFGDIGIDYQVAGCEMLESLREGPFITVSNHPYGGIDGMILIDLFGHIRADFKVMVNTFLSMIKTLNVSFINVVPTGDGEHVVNPESVTGVKRSLSHLRDGHPLGLFPSGAVSDLNLFNGGIRDRKWQEPVIRLIKKANVPVVPVRFFDRNSALFYSLGLMSWKIRMLRLPREILNKARKTIRVAIGSIITPDQQQEYHKPEDLCNFLRKSVYDMPLPDNLVWRSGMSERWPEFAVEPQLQRMNIDV